MILKLIIMTLNFWVQMIKGEINMDKDENIIDKIADSGCLEAKELEIIEAALKLWCIYDEILDVLLGITKDNKFNLKYRVKR